GSEDFLREDVEERLSENRGDSVSALAAVESEPGALASGDGEGGDATVAQGRFSAKGGLFPHARIGGVAVTGTWDVIGGLKSASERRISGCSAFNKLLIESGDLGEVDGGGLLEQTLLFGFGKGIEMGKDVALSVGLVT